MGKMEKAKKKAANILENEDLGTREKAKEIQRMYKKAQSVGKKPEVKYVVAKKATAQKRPQRPAGRKGMYKQVDPRMKKDMFNDPDENLPDWFVKEEQYHMRKVPEFDPQA